MDLIVNNPLIKKPSLNGINTRKGRPQKWLSYSFDKCAENAFDIAGAFMKYARDNWDTLSHNEKVSTMSVAMPIALKRIPDKHEVIQLTLNATGDDMAALLSLAQANLSARSNIYSQHIVEAIDAPIIDQSTSQALSSSHQVKPETKANVL